MSQMYGCRVSSMVLHTSAPVLSVAGLRHLSIVGLAAAVASSYPVLSPLPRLSSWQPRIDGGIYFCHDSFWVLQWEQSRQLPQYMVPNAHRLSFEEHW